jgi:hypothetical protein
MNAQPYFAQLRLTVVWIILTATAIGAPTPQNQGSASSLIENEARALQGNRLKHQTDLFTGSFAYSIPIEAAPARNGSEPDLALTYSSSGENGWCGVGWNLEIGYIERNTKDGIPVRWDNQTPPSPMAEYDDSKGFVFNLFGRQGKLILFSGNEFRPEIDEHFMRFILNTTANRWELYDKNGNVFYFGKNSSSRMQKTGWQNNSSGTFRWALDEIVTVTGDQTIIQYQSEGLNGSEKLLYPYLISYNGHVANYNGLSGGLTPTHTIEFVREPRSDKTISYRSAFRVEQSRRLKSIVCKVGASLVRRYELTYVVSSSSKRSLLEKVQVLGHDNSSPLPAQTFSYSLKPMGFQAGLIDWIDMYVPAPADPMWEHISGNDAGTGALVVDLVDIDGDALPDRVRTKQQAAWENYLVQRNRNIQASDGKGHFTATEYIWGPVSGQQQTSLLPWCALNSGYVRFLDINGDGRPDRVMDFKDYYSVAGQLYDRFALEKNTGTGFTPDTWLDVKTLGVNYTAARAIENAPYVTIMDINGDSIPDRVMMEDQPPYDYFMVQFGTGSGFLPVRRFGPYASQNESHNVLFAGTGSAWVKFIDINGDNLPDRVMHPITSGVAQSLTKFVVEFNTGYSFEQATTTDWLGVDPQSQSSPDYGWIENHPFVGLFDINGDHLPDRVMLNHSDHTKWYVQINNGSGFETKDNFINVERGAAPDGFPGWYGIRGWDADGTVCGLSDINGDGLIDRVLSDYSALGTGGASDFKGFRVNLNQGPVPDLMSAVNNGIGGTVTVQYKPSTTWDNRKDPSNDNSERLLPFVVQTVNTVSVSDGINPTQTTTYEYAGGFYDASRREFAGFACVTNTEPASVVEPSRPRRKQIYWFHQGGGRDNATSGEYQDNGSFAKRGMAYRIETYGNDSPTPLLYNVIVNQVHQQALTPATRFFPFVQRTFVFDYPGGGSPKVAAAKFEYDTATGNLMKQISYGEVTGWNLSDFTFTDQTSADTQYRHIAYAAITGNANIKDHPSYERLASDEAGSQVIQETKYTYYPNHGL